MITSIWTRPGQDASEAYEIRRQVFQEELGMTSEQERDALDPYALHLVLKLNDVPVAAGRLTFGGVGVGNLSRICVLKKYRRQGIGDGLVKVLDYKASTMGMQVSQVETPEEYERFFRRIGYVPVEGKTAAGMILMRKETNDGSGENCAHQCAGS